MEGATTSKAARRRFSGGSPSSDHDAGGEDRLSALPEGLRLHILTLIPLRCAIRTGILSSSWRDLWRHRWPHPSSIDLSPAAPDSDIDPFASSVDDLIARRGRRTLDSFSLSFRPSQRHLPQIQRWLAYAASCSVSVLRLDLSPSSPSSTDPRRSRRRGRQHALLFAFSCECPSLVTLSLSGFRLASPTRFKPLRSLQYLSLHYLRLSDASLRRIITALPLLRSLDLRRCSGLKSIFIPGPAENLATIAVVDCQKASEINAFAPNLSSFRFHGGFPAKHRFRGVWIPLDELCLTSGGTGIGLPFSDWVRAFGGIVGNVRVLTLCSVALQYLVNSPLDVMGQFASLRNMQELQLAMLVLADGDLMDLYRFFKKCHCPRLERLFVELPEQMGDPYMEKHLEVAEESPPEDGLEHLKVVKLRNFKAHWNEMRLLRFILETASMLDSMVVVSPRSLLEEKFSHFMRDSNLDVLDVLRSCLASIPKASASARIVLNDYDDMSLCPSHELL